MGSIVSKTLCIVAFISKKGNWFQSGRLEAWRTEEWDETMPKRRKQIKSRDRLDQSVQDYQVRDKFSSPREMERP